MESQKITSRTLAKEIRIPGSKSFANRALLFGALSDKNITISDIPGALDVQEMIGVLKSLSLCTQDSSTVSLNSSFPKDEIPSEKIISLNLGEGGTTIRFITSLLALGKNTYRLHVHPRFKKRPHGEFLNFLRSLGVKVNESDSDDVLCDLKGPMIFPKLLEIDCSKTTQVATAFYLISTFNDFAIKLTHLVSSKAYIDMTKKKFMDKEKERFTVPVDMSSAGYFITLSLFTQEHIFSQILSIDDTQADSMIFNVLEQIGAEFDFSPYLKVTPKLEYNTFEIDGSQCLDLIPTLVVMACFIPGTSVIKNISGLKYKETNRLNGIKNLLDQIEISYEVANDKNIKITGKSNHKKNLNIKTLPDHRLIMASALFLKINGGGEVSPFENINKSFNDFFKIIS